MRRREAWKPSAEEWAAAEAFLGRASEAGVPAELVIRWREVLQRTLSPPLDRHTREALAVECPTCGVPAGELCRGVTRAARGRQVRTAHGERVWKARRPAVEAFLSFGERFVLPPSPGRQSRG